MFSLVRYFTRWLMERTPARNFCVLGLSGAGKTALVNDIRKMVNLPAFYPLIPTFGQNVSNFKYNDARITIWDLGGEKSFRESWKYYLEDAHSVIYVVDSSHPELLDESRATLNVLLQAPDLAGKPIFILFNKQDLSNSLSEQEVKSATLKEDTLELMSGRKWKCQMSVGDGTTTHFGAVEALDWCLKEMS